jgi:hypothetical protein
LWDNDKTNVGISKIDMFYSEKRFLGVECDEGIAFW